MDLPYTVLVCTWLLFPSSGAEHEGCTTPQYLEIGKEGLVNCSFHENFFGVFWYNSTDTVSNKPILKLINSAKSGEGYMSGEFDVQPNGSLIINNVSLVHSHVFTVAKFSSQSDDPVRFAVSIISSVSPVLRRPIINECWHERECYLQVHENFEVTCSVKKSRPAIAMQWVEHTFFGERNVSSKINFTQLGITFTSSAIATDLFEDSPELIHLVCKADAPPGMLQERQASILIELNTTNRFSFPPVAKYFTRGSRLTLPCSDDETVALVWKKSTFTDELYDTILYSLFDEKHFAEVYSQQYELGDSGSLVIRKVSIQDEGFYRCVYSNGITSGIRQYEMLVKVDPVLPYPVVEGCNKQQHCVLEVQQEGNLTCSVTGIRPQVQLEWKASDERTTQLVSFVKDKLTVNRNEDTFTVVLISQYRITSTLPTRFTLECTVAGSNTFLGTTKVDMIYVGDTEDTTEHQFPWLLVIFIPVVAGLLVCVIGGFMTYRARRKSKLNVSYTYSEEEEEMITKATPRNDLSDKKEIFLEEIASKYEELYKKVQPIPYIREKMYCVDEIFVEGGMKVLISNEIIREANESVEDYNERIKRHGDVWEKIESYRNIFTDERIKSTRRILEGAPGYGKSTLALQLAYDWCKGDGVDGSNTDILIFLRLRQLKGISSIFRAIKLLILPMESTLTEGDIERIITSSKSVMIILDGYDEYPEKDSNNGTEIMDIITGKKFRQFQVILTTRTSLLPKEYSPVTKRIKLTGFDEKTRDDYIRKAVVGDDVVTAEKVKRRLDDNPVLRDLCQVPLIFVLFAHMSHDIKNFQQIYSVTSSFSYMIACFHNHMRNKKDENKDEGRSFETKHDELDKVAFEGLLYQHIVWWKDDLCQKLGHNFYDHYVRLGILVEDKVLDISKDLGNFETEITPYKIEVRFFHKLFCEWYAAHYIWQNVEDIIANDCSDIQVANLGSKHNNVKPYLDPYEVQYLYRFACGLESGAAERIIKHLNRKKDTRVFAILCTLEQDFRNKDGLQTIKDLCSKDVIIREDNSLLLQRSIVQLLQIASSKKVISISRVRLIGCYRSVDLHAKSIHLQSRHSIPVLSTLKELWIEERKREMTEKEIKDLLNYSSKCTRLEKLWFYYCLLPQSIQDEHFSVLLSRKMKVMWDPLHTMEPRYLLNLENGRWEHRKTNVQMTDEDYEEVQYAQDWKRDSKH
ncbi:NLR family CARD domain-containing protein 4 [Holothuria leucospilota]|uniref:NLR family CARD domain-containing protein 4 n=1 Tax=Holothuria leucospilota TaxID=206669 RepID=A0A9Q1HK28_HOLLE|nr:NLR family CARD domain-containing protein 4 [Holothuria leucospilota]